MHTGNLPNWFQRSPSEKDDLEKRIPIDIDYPSCPLCSHRHPSLKVVNSAPEPKTERPKEHLRHSQHLLPTGENGDPKLREHLLLDCAAPRTRAQKECVCSKRNFRRQ